MNKIVYTYSDLKPGAAQKPIVELTYNDFKCHSKEAWEQADLIELHIGATGVYPLTKQTQIEKKKETKQMSTKVSKTSTSSIVKKHVQTKHISCYHSKPTNAASKQGRKLKLFVSKALVEKTNMQGKTGIVLDGNQINIVKRFLQSVGEI